MESPNNPATPSLLAMPPSQSPCHPPSPRQSPVPGCKPVLAAPAPLLLSPFPQSHQR